MTHDRVVYLSVAFVMWLSYQIGHRLGFSKAKLNDAEVNSTRVVRHNAHLVRAFVNYQQNPDSLKHHDLIALQNAYGHAIEQIPNPYFIDNIEINDDLLKTFNDLSKRVKETKPTNPVILIN